MKYFLRRIGLSLILSLTPFTASAAGGLLYRYQHHLFTIYPSQFSDWRGKKEIWTYEGKPVKVPAEFRVDGDRVPPLPAGFERREEVQWNRDAIRGVLEQKIASVFDRVPGSVVIHRSGSGAITFDGVGLPGRKVDLDQAVTLTIEALEQNVSDITLPVAEIQPKIVVDDPALEREGIREVVTVGESDFSGSAKARRHNIGVGLNRFNGTIIPAGSAFSFDETLGPVTAKEGYLKELVIKGDKTLPDYGGGLCQVGTTAYRGVWEYGFPILQRKNHSYAVHYYGPQGTDATVYPPNVDMRFLNNSSGALLIQTFVDKDLAYFIYYGTRDGRTSEVIGPYTWGSVAPPPDKVEYTTEIPAGTTRKVGERVPGMKALWYRVLGKNGQETVESVYSGYEARPRFDQIGVDATSPLLGSGSTKTSPNR
ncbi:MAG: VanW family protein [Candidatus Peribacteraceae bacterium]|nr:VanW family protein [Candidatus Peribacteraceae bacterium]MDD5075267.1 VanW family protein [Candidatus Peribacteraceae bacterium]